MEPEVLPLDKALQGLVVLALIPVVAFALWTDYLTRPDSKPEDRNESSSPERPGEFEVEKIRLGSLFVILFQCTLFIGSTEVQTAYPIITQVLFLFSVLLQIFVQYGAEKKFRAKDSKSGEILGLIMRIGISWLIGGAFYLGILALSIKMAAVAAHQVHASPALETALLIFGGFLGVILGFGLNFALSPLHLKLMLPTSQLTDPALQAQFESCFHKAGYAPPSFRVIELTTLKISDVLVTGLQQGRGPFRPALFVSRTLVSTLLPQELDAIVMNQVSHRALSHLKKRFLFSLALILGTVILAILSIFIGQAFLPGQTALDILAPSVALASFLTSFKFMAIQAKKHELEADLYSIQALGVELEDLSSALRKLDLAVSLDVPANVQILPKGYPDTERRIELIKAHLEESHRSQHRSQERSQDTSQSKAG